MHDGISIKSETDIIGKKNNELVNRLSLFVNSTVKHTIVICRCHMR